MLLKTILCGAVLASGALAFVHLHHPSDCCPGARLLAHLAPGEAQGKDQAGPSGVWVQKGGEVKIAFVGKDVMKISPHGDNEVLVIVCKFTAAKDGVVQARITELEGKD